MNRRKLFESVVAQDPSPGEGPAYVSVQNLRQHLAEFLLYAGRPVVIMRGRSEVGYFLPARCWRQREDDPVAAAATREMLAAAGYQPEDVDRSEREYARMRERTIIHPRHPR
ncbi:MAG: hypothetical protein ACREPC_06735 [Stenotrophomonas sp.]|uniref:hypothetical protein n=1 Tax=Stenotrophomonas sp. TaxID=69392 RepID=UPI003D6CC5FA